MTVLSLINRFKTGFAKFTLLILTVIVLGGCKKEYQQLPYADIVSFSLTDAQGGTLKAALENNEIIVYWPPEQAVPEYISPQIKIAEGASISPASGSKVVFKAGTSYTVTAQNGKTSLYKIRPVINSIIPYIKSIDGFQTLNQKTFLLNGGNLIVTGDYFNTEKDKTKLFLVSKDDKEVEVKGLSVTPLEVRVLGIVTSTGTYKAIKLQSGDRTLLSNKDFVLIDDPKPFIPIDVFKVPQTLKRGDRITISGGKNLTAVNNVELVTATGNKVYALKIVQSTADRLVLEIPADFPTGQYGEVRCSFPAGEYMEAGRRRIYLEDYDAYITVTAN